MNKDKSFDKIIKTYSSNIKGLIKNITGEQNEDLEQEVYIKTWKNIDKYQESGKFNSWVKRITINTCKDYFRSKLYKQKQQNTNDDSAISVIKETKSAPETDFDRKQRQKIIIEAINNLKPKFKKIIILYDIHNLSYEEISIKLKCPVGTVKSRLFNARKLLQESLKDLIKE